MYCLWLTFGLLLVIIFSTNKAISLKFIVLMHHGKAEICQEFESTGPTWSENDGPFLPKYGPWENK
jgi:hypothetical protein